MTSSVRGQVQQDISESLLSVSFDPTCRDAMQGGGRWKRYIRIEETPAGLHITADTLFQLIWNILWGRGSLYRHSASRLQHVVHQLNKRQDPNLYEPFKLFCSRVITSRIRSGNIDRTEVSAAVQILLGLKLLVRFSTLARISLNETCDRIFGKIRSGIEQGFMAAVAELLSLSENKEWLDGLNISSCLFQALLNSCETGLDLEELFTHFQLRVYTNESPSLPYTLGELKKILKDESQTLQPWQQNLFSSPEFKQIVYNFSYQLSKVPESATSFNTFRCLDVLVLAWMRLDRLIDSSMMAVGPKINKDADAVLIASIGLLACAKLSSSSIEKVKAALKQNLDDENELRAQMNMQLALDYLRL